MDTKTHITLRSKTLGVLIKDARLASRMSIKECAEAIGVSSGSFSSYESGKKSPSLPELEVLAFLLNISISHFWGTESISDNEAPIEKLDLPRLVSVRQRMIGALLRQERLKASISMKALAKEVNIPKSRIKAYELGERAISLPELEGLLSVLGGHTEDFLDKNGPIGLWLTRQNAVEAFLNLSPELQEFVCQPVNRPYLDLAQNLSDLSADKLRSVAEGILNITF
ncbi:MAG: helix-turn-helix transcriptional regulator [Anaerolineae bacterium]|jgi:transcriptional regulator with XRE-family HTH domain|nr:helix-turn-helix transcriptional regulator [Anaerolineae bacterium]MBT3714666.1 helix-turn-helix transcriptional regulator [Anaerolineae bacterium]MBT4310039.1 helix-turn-helix transcriptional regulator [Anaerolineae bacterium]MBT4457449.1 helix-turn-helix transcriptional regulator [Anaerolineae bacterium]MBT4843035.1 helix-turn-helix transcriptional regulator [Anaerolineae bacterium]